MVISAGGFSDEFVCELYGENEHLGLIINCCPHLNNEIDTPDSSRKIFQVGLKWVFLDGRKG